MKINVEQLPFANKDWLNQGNVSIGRFEVSTTGTIGSHAPEPEVEDLAKVINIVKARIRSKPRSLVTVLADQRAFLPISSLKAGAEQGSAVCRLARHFPLEAFQAFLEDIKSEIQKWKVADKFDSVEKVKEIFSIPNQLSIEGLKSARNKTRKLEISISNLDALSRITENQLAKINPIPIGTGFLIGGKHLLTNHHVISSKEVAQQCIAQFNYIEDEKGHLQPSIDYELAPEMLFVSEPELDYTLVQLKSDRFAQLPGYYFGWLPLSEDSDNVCPGLSYLQLDIDQDFDLNSREQLNAILQAKLEEMQNNGFIVKQDWITQYEQENRVEKPILVILPPLVQQNQSEAELATLESEGESKIEVKLAELEAALKSIIPEKSDQQPIFSRQFLPGDDGFIVHHPKGKRKQISPYQATERGLYKHFLRYNTATDYGSSGSPVFNARWELVALHHAVIRPTTNNSGQKSVQQGIRICQIVSDLKRKSVSNSKLQSFIDDFVLTQEELEFPPLPSVLEFDGISNCIDITQPTKELAADFAPFGIEAWVNPYSSSADATIFSQVCQETWYEDFKEDSIFGQYILALKITPEGHIVFSKEPFWKISSSAFPQNGLLYPSIQSGEERSHPKHPLDILALQSIDQEEVQINLVIDPLKPVEDRILEEKILKEKIKALQCVLYCLGFFPDETYSRQSENYRETYFRTLSGWLDENTRTAIKRFNAWCFGESLTSTEISRIQVEEKLITIPSAAISIFKVRGTFLGLGTKRGTFLGLGTNRRPRTSADEEYKNHHGLRVLELQHCLESLDWNSPYLLDQKFPETPKISLNGEFDWPQNGRKPEAWLQAESITAYAVKRLQSTYCQPDEGVFGALTLAALEQAKTYEVRTREKLPIGEFSHVAVTFDPEDKEVKIYINGQLTNRRYIGRQKVGHICKAVIGARSSNSALSNAQDSYTAYLRGAMSEVRLWKKALQAKDIARKIYYRLSESNIHDENLVGYWRLEEGRFREADQNRHQDSQGIKANIKERGYCFCNYAAQSRLYASESKLQVQEASQQVSLRSACNFPTIPLPFGLKAEQEIILKIMPQNLNTISQNEVMKDEPGITVEFWIKFRYGNGEIITEGESEEGFYSLSWIDGKIHLKLSSENLLTKIQTQEAVRDTQIWHHVAFSWGATSKEVRLYLNGKLQDVVAIQAQVQTLNYETTYKSIITFPANEFATNHQTLRIAPKNSKNPQSNIHESQSLNCSIAELRVWQVVRPDSAIKAYLNQRLNPEEEVKNRLVGYWRFDGKENFTVQSDYCKVSLELQGTPKELEWITPQSKILKFTDVNDQHWVAKILDGLHDVGLLGSFVDGNAVQFRPDDPILREEFVVLLLNAFGGEPLTDRANVLLRFKDKTEIKSEHFNDIEYVWRLGLISGERENHDDKSPVREITFAPNRPTPRCQVFAAIFDSLRSQAPTISDAEEREKLLKGLSDIQSQKTQFSWISLETIAAGIQNELIVGKTANPTQLDFQSEATRAEVAAMLYQALVYQKRVDRIETNRILKVVDTSSS
jgi:S1-C subfamily serine protease